MASHSAVPTLSHPLPGHMLDSPGDQASAWRAAGRTPGGLPMSPAAPAPPPRPPTGATQLRVSHTRVRAAPWPGAASYLFVLEPELVGRGPSGDHSAQHPRNPGPAGEGPSGLGRIPRAELTRGITQ